MKIIFRRQSPIFSLALCCWFSFCSLVFLGQLLEAAEQGPLLKAAERSPIPPKNDKGLQVLATVNNQQITVSDFEKEMIKQNGLNKEYFNNMDQKMKVLDEMIRFELFASMAIKAGYDKDPEIVESLKKQMVQKYLRENIEPKLQNVDVTEDEIKGYYQEHIDEYQKPSLAKIAMIWVKTSGKISQKEKQTLKKRAEEALTEARKESPEDNSFGEAARKYSDDIATKHKGGIIGWVSSKEKRRDDIPLEALQAAMSLKQIGEISQIVTASQGYYLVKLVGKKVFQLVTLLQAEPEIRSRLYAEKKRVLYSSYYEKMKKDNLITIDRDLLDSLKGLGIEGDSHEHRPPSFPVDVK